MPLTQKQKPGKGIPRKSRNPARKVKYARYKLRSTCGKCGKLFRSPRKKLAHRCLGWRGDEFPAGGGR